MHLQNFKEKKEFEYFKELFYKLSNDQTGSMDDIVSTVVQKNPDESIKYFHLVDPIKNKKVVHEYLHINQEFTNTVISNIKNKLKKNNINKENENSTPFGKQMQTYSSYMENKNKIKMTGPENKSKGFFGQGALNHLIHGLEKYIGSYPDLVGTRSAKVLGVMEYTLNQIKRFGTPEDQVYALEENKEKEASGKTKIKKKYKK